MRHHRVIEVPNRDTLSKRSKIDENGQRSGFESVNLEMNYDESVRMFSAEIFQSVVNGVFDPPQNMTPRMSTLPTP